MWQWAPRPRKQRTRKPAGGGDEEGSATPSHTLPPPSRERNRSCGWTARRPTQTPLRDYCCNHARLSGPARGRPVKCPHTGGTWAAAPERNDLSQNRCGWVGWWGTARRAVGRAGPPLQCGSPGPAVGRRIYPPGYTTHGRAIYRQGITPRRATLARDQRLQCQDLPARVQGGCWPVHSQPGRTPAPEPRVVPAGRPGSAYAPAAR